MSQSPTPNEKQHEQAAEIQRIAREELAWLDPLCRDPNFQRLVEQERKGQARHMAVALDMKSSSKARKTALCCYNAVKDLLDWPDRQRQKALDILRNAKPENPKQSPY